MMYKGINDFTVVRNSFSYSFKHYIIEFSKMLRVVNAHDGVQKYFLYYLLIPINNGYVILQNINT